MKPGKYFITLEFPDRWWFRYLIYAQFTFMLLEPGTRQISFLMPGIVLLIFYLLRSPDMAVVDAGVLIRIFDIEYLLSWGNIRKVQLTPKQIFIYDGFILPIFAFYIRRNFKEMQQALAEKIPEKVITYKFPLPL